MPSHPAMQAPRRSKRQKQEAQNQAPASSAVESQVSSFLRPAPVRRRSTRLRDTQRVRRVTTAAPTSKVLQQIPPADNHGFIQRVTPIDDWDIDHRPDHMSNSFGGTIHVWPPSEAAMEFAGLPSPLSKNVDFSALVPEAYSRNAANYIDAMNPTAPVSTVVEQPKIEPGDETHAPVRCEHAQGGPTCHPDHLPVEFDWNTHVRVKVELADEGATQSSNLISEPVAVRHVAIKKPVDEADFRYSSRPDKKSVIQPQLEAPRPEPNDTPEAECDSTSGNAQCHAHVLAEVDQNTHHDVWKSNTKKENGNARSPRTKATSGCDVTLTRTGKARVRAEVDRNTHRDVWMPNTKQEKDTDRTPRTKATSDCDVTPTRKGEAAKFSLWSREDNATAKRLLADLVAAKLVVRKSATWGELEEVLESTDDGRDILERYDEEQIRDKFKSLYNNARTREEKQRASAEKKPADRSIHRQPKLLNGADNEAVTEVDNRFWTHSMIGVWMGTSKSVRSSPSDSFRSDPATPGRKGEKFTLWTWEDNLMMKILLADLVKAKLVVRKSASWLELEEVLERTEAGKDILKRYSEEKIREKYKSLYNNARKRETKRRQLVF